jgi:hypothetical protein
MIFPEYSEKSGEFDKNRETGRLQEIFGRLPVKSGELECLRTALINLQLKTLCINNCTCLHRAAFH